MSTKPVKRGEYTGAQYKSILGEISDVIGEAFYLAYPPDRVSETLSRMLPEERNTVQKSETPSRISSPAELVNAFPLSWSHDILLARRNRSDYRSRSAAPLVRWRELTKVQYSYLDVDTTTRPMQVPERPPGYGVRE